MERLLANPLFVPGGFLALFFLILVVAGGQFVPQDPLKTDIWHVLAPPGEDYPLGTDNLGRCIFSRLVTGSRFTLGTALIVEAFVLAIGILAGTSAGYFGGILDKVLLILIDVLLAFPSIILALVIAGFLGAGLTNLVIAFVSVYWVEPARIARNISRSVREKDFILSARASGSGAFKIIRRHIAPHVFPNMLIYGTLDLSSIIIGVSSMSFIGLGVKPPAPEWGALLSEGRAYMRENPFMILPAIGCIMLSAACFQFLGEALRDAMNPRKSHLPEAFSKHRILKKKRIILRGLFCWRQ
ncbi:MAG: ABC transporter permease [Treponema sp.]|jgi:peptide/nickel transport system permease protein|nr:ABC transporter permease [Treponema sp.]